MPEIRGSNPLEGKVVFSMDVAVVFSMDVAVTRILFAFSE
jgi:hypothetical protein